MGILRLIEYRSCLARWLHPAQAPEILCAFLDPGGPILWYKESAYVRFPLAPMLEQLKLILLTYTF